VINLIATFLLQGRFVITFQPKQVVTNNKHNCCSSGREFLQSLIFVQSLASWKLGTIIIMDYKQTQH